MTTLLQLEAALAELRVQPPEHTLEARWPQQKTDDDVWQHADAGANARPNRVVKTEPNDNQDVGDDVPDEEHPLDKDHGGHHRRRGHESGLPLRPPRRHARETVLQSREWVPSPRADRLEALLVGAGSKMVALHLGPQEVPQGALQQLGTRAQRREGGAHAEHEGQAALEPRALF